jgi:DNA-binding MarR family transcriptional regulator
MKRSRVRARAGPADASSVGVGTRRARQVAEIEDLANVLPRQISGLARVLYGATGSTLSRGMRSVLFALSAAPLRISQVALQEGIGQSAATRMVTRLEALELVRRERDPADRRVVMVTLTDRGRAELERMREQSRQVMREVLRGCSPRELRRLTDAADALDVLSELVRKLSLDGSSRSPQSTTAAASSRRTRRALPS